MEKRTIKKTKKFLSLVMLMVLVAVLPACVEEKKIVLASKPMTEQFIVAEMLTALIEQDTDIKVEQKLGVGGGTSNIHPALLKGDVDLYPEYTGTGWLFVLKESPIKEPDQVYQKVKEAYQEEYGIVWSGLYGFNNTYGMAIKKEVAEKLQIRTYSDLAEKSEQLIFASNPDFYEREDGFPGVSQVYNFRFKKTVEVDIGLKYEAIESGQADVIDIFSTDSKLEKYGLITLEDDKNYFPSYYAATLIRQDTLDKYPELGDVLAKLDGQISNEEMTAMNYLVEIDKKEPKKVALDFLDKKGLLKK